VTDDPVEHARQRARERVRQEDEKLAGLEAEIARLATTLPGPVLLALVRVLVEMVCSAQGPTFRVHNKIKFYEGVLGTLRQNGVV
jgi:hypothetical protein